MVKVKLKEYIEEKGITVQFIHEKTEIRYATLLDIINNKRKSVNLEYLAKIMEAINISDISLILKYEKWFKLIIF